MGLLSWLGGPFAPRKSHHGPTPEGVYRGLPKGAVWSGPGPDPAGDAEKFAPAPADLVFDVLDWQWQRQLKGTASYGSADKTFSFDFLFVLSDGTSSDSVETHRRDRTGKLKLVSKDEWVIPAGHPTRELALISTGDPTTNLIHRLQECFGWPQASITAHPQNTAVVGSVVILRGKVAPETGRFTARTKVILGERGNGPYCEFFFNLNSHTRKAWLSEKSPNYRPAIIQWFARANVDPNEGLASVAQ